MWAKVKAWYGRNTWWIRYALVAIGAIAGVAAVVRSIAKLTEKVRQPTTWKTLPGNQNQVAVRNPNTGGMDIVRLPAGTKARDLVSVGITKREGTYEIEIKHETTNRRNPTGTGDALDHIGSGPGRD